MKKKTKTILAWGIISVLILYFILGCSPTQRLARLHDKHPDIFQKASDTIQHTDTVRVMFPYVEVDTFVLYKELTDTLSVQSENVSAKLWKQNDTIFLHAKADTITVKVPYEVKIPVEKYSTPPPKKSKMIWILLILLIAIILNKLIFKA